MARLLLVSFLSILAVGLAAPAQAGAAPNLDRLYIGDDGSLVSLRLVGSAVYGFAENPGLKTASVLRGTLVGNAIRGEWYDVPKGTRRQTGDLELTIGQGGRTLQLRTSGDDFGPDVMVETEPGRFPWPAPAPARYQGLSNADLDGLYTADDGARWWVRQVGSDTFVAVAEQEQQLGVRPSYTSVFVGEKNGAFVVGAYADVAKGVSRSTGPLTFGTGPFRVLGLVGGGDRTKKLRPQYSMDFDAFAESIEDALKGRVVGYSYAIAMNGITVRTGAGGFRTRGVDGWRPFNVDTQSEAASTAKTITAVAMLKALASRGLPIYTNVEPYLPACWKRGSRISSLTFRHLLTHTSELEESGELIGVDYDEDPWTSIARVIELGRTGPKNEYNNFNFRLLRILLPSVLAPQNVRDRIEQLGCGKNKAQLNYELSNVFATYVTNVVLKPAGIEDGFGMPIDNHAYGYADRDKPGVPVSGTFIRSGSGMLAISAPQYIRFLSRLARSEYGSGVLETMTAERIGFDGTSFTGNVGRYYGKNGGWRGFKTQAMIFPNGVQAYAMVNSPPVGDALSTVLGNAYAASLK